jgi:uncharacterized protein with NRDE domain
MAAVRAIDWRMCLLAFAWQAHPRWRLVAAGNRDERHDRPASPLARWAKPDHLIAGMDLQSGGTWLGVSEQGRFATVTNVRNPDGRSPDRPSRGALVTDYLAGEGLYADPANIDPAAFNPFNLVTVDRDHAYFLSNRPEPVRRELAKGIYGLSNGMLDEPWAKTLQIKAGLREWIDGGGERPEALLDVLALEQPAGLYTGPAEDPIEPALTPIFIRDPVYGTRSGTVVAVDADGGGLVIERRFTAEGERAGETALRFSWPG